jgi:hypothetical protein
VDAATGVIALAASVPGTYTVTYAAGTAACPTTATASVSVSSPPTAVFAYGAPSYCTTASAVSPVLIGAATAGTFTAAPAGLRLDATTGAIALTSSQPGVYTVTNTVAAAGGCAAVAETVTLTVVALPVAALLAATPTTFCQGGSVDLTAPAGPGQGYQFLLNGAAISGATSASYTATASGDYSIVVTSAGGCTATSSATAVVVNPLPATPVLTATYNGTTTTLISSAAAGNQFYFNGASISGATDPTYVVNGTPAQLGAYSVVVTSASGCASAPSAPLVVTANQRPLAGTSMNVYPNPTPDGRFTVELAGYRKAAELSVLNVLGQVVFTSVLPAASSTTTTQTVDLGGLAAGVYVLRVKTAGGLDTRRLVKE